MLDTGASASVLTPAMAKTLNLTVNRYVVAETPGGTVSLPVGSVESLQAGGAVARNLEVAVSDALTFGLLGQDFFRNYDITIKENVIEFRSR